MGATKVSACPDVGAMAVVGEAHSWWASLQRPGHVGEPRVLGPPSDRVGPHGGGERMGVEVTDLPASRRLRYNALPLTQDVSAVR